MRLVEAIWRSRSRLYRAADRPGGRRLLAALATRAARRETSDDVAIVYRGAWLLRFGEHYVPWSSRFAYCHGDAIRHAYQAQFENLREIWLHLYEPQLGDVVIDVGAGVGSETYVLANAVGPQGRVVAIEAHPETFRVLEAQTRANGLTNVLLCACAVTDAAREVFIEDRDRHERNTIRPEWEPGLLRAPIEGLPLDEICRRFGVDRIDFLKMNIEGAEAAAIAGMGEMIEHTRQVAIACHDFLADPGSEELRTRRRVEDFLRGHGFTVVVRSDDSREYVRDHVHAYRER